MSNKKLSIKTDEKYLRLMAYDPACGKSRCECCHLHEGSPACEQVKALCCPQGASDLSGLEQGGYFEDLPPREKGSRGDFRGNRGNFHGNRGGRHGGFHHGNRDRGDFGNRNGDQSRVTRW